MRFRLPHRAHKCLQLPGVEFSIFADARAQIQSERFDGQGGGTAAAISAMCSSWMTPGPLGMCDTSPSAMVDGQVCFLDAGDAADFDAGRVVHGDSL